MSFNTGTMPNAQQMGNNFTTGLTNNAQQSATKTPSNFVEVKSANDRQVGGSQSDVTDANDARAETDNNAAANAAAGYEAPPSPPDIPTDLTRINNATIKDYKYYDVGTSVNKNNDAGGGGTAANSFKGTPSLFNNYYLIRYHSLNDDKNKLPNKLGVVEGNEDYSGLASNPLYKNPTTSIIVKTFDGSKSVDFFGKPEKIYSYSDFLYLKDYNPYGNNKLITLRRFMGPVYDECRVAIKSDDLAFRKPIAKALTYINDTNKLSSFTSMTIGFPISPVSGAGVTKPDPTKLAGPTVADLGNTGSSAIASSPADLTARMLSVMSGATSADVFKNWSSDYDPWQNGPLQDLVYGPINVITDTKIRGAGLTFTNQLSVTFDYSLKAIEKINPKAAMLDIFSNMLALTYNHAAFWGGENRFIIDRGNFPLVSPDVITGALAKLSKSDNLEAITELAKNFTGAFTAASDFGAGLVKDIVTDGAKALTEKGGVVDTAITILAKRDGIAAELFKKIYDGTGQKLTGNPTGEWHLQVGNPFAPIMMIGNLWCTGTTFGFNDEFSADDFPTELTFKCTLEHGRSRDSSDIQSIFNAGGGRIYYPYKDAKIDANASSSTYNSESAFVFKPDDILGSWNRVTTDRNGLALDSILIKDKTGNPKSDDVAKTLVQTVKDFTKK